jgi:RNA polymerase sigma-70 factor (ECF subfamily)
VPLSQRTALHGDAERHAETALLVRVRDDGDHAAFVALFDIFSARLRAYAQQQGATRELAENVVQDVMVTAWTRACLFDPAKASARTWMYTLLRNRLIDEHRASDRRQRAHDNYAADKRADTIDSGPDGSSTLASTKLTALLAELPEEQARVVLMAYVEGKSHREIATELKLPIGTIKSRTRLALNRLRKLMEADE